MALHDLDVVRLLHVSDTHGLHRQVERRFPMPDADILFHTGDFVDKGLPAEFADFNDWLGELSDRYPHRIVIFGNHEYGAKGLTPAMTKALLPNATVLEHELIEVLGLRIFGSPWVPGHKASAPGDGKVAHRFDEIPEGTDVLLTHGSPHRIMDYCELGTLQWGGSKALREHVLRARPRAHLFGHMHEQRGVWHHDAGQPFQGGIEYELGNGDVHPTWKEAPPMDYPCQLISCNAMKNHGNIDAAVGNARADCIAGGARLIMAERCAGDEAAGWHFRVHGLGDGDAEKSGGV